MFNKKFKISFLILIISFNASANIFSRCIERILLKVKGSDSIQKVDKTKKIISKNPLQEETIQYIQNHPRLKNEHSIFTEELLEKVPIVENEYQKKLLMYIADHKNLNQSYLALNLLEDLKNPTQYEELLKVIDISGRPGETSIKVKKAIYKNLAQKYYEGFTPKEPFNWAGVNDTQKRRFELIAKRYKNDDEVNFLAYITSREKDSHLHHFLKDNSAIDVEITTNSDTAITARINAVSVDAEKLQMRAENQDFSLRFARLSSIPLLAASKKIKETPSLKEFRLVAGEVVNVKLQGMLREQGFHEVSRFSSVNKRNGRDEVWREMEFLMKRPFAKDTNFNQLSKDLLKERGSFLKDLSPESIQTINNLNNEAQYLSLDLTIRYRSDKVQIDNNSIVRLASSFKHQNQAFALKMLIDETSGFYPSFEKLKKLDDNPHTLDALRIILGSNDLYLTPKRVKIKEDMLEKAINKALKVKSKSDYKTFLKNHKPESESKYY